MAPEKPPLTTSLAGGSSIHARATMWNLKELPWLSVTREAFLQQGRARRDLDTGLPPPHTGTTMRIWRNQPGQ